MKDLYDDLAEINKTFIAYFHDFIHMRDRTFVFGEGAPDASIMLVGEAPGKHEALQGRPFVGEAGKNLDHFLSMISLKREKIYITNVVKFRPFKINYITGRESNRPPTALEVQQSVEWLHQEVLLIKPKLIVTLGNTALRAVGADKHLSIGQVHGVPIPLKISDSNIDTVLYPLYHPASIIYRKELMEKYIVDLNQLRAYLENALWYDRIK